MTRRTIVQEGYCSDLARVVPSSPHVVALSQSDRVTGPDDRPTKPELALVDGRRARSQRRNPRGDDPPQKGNRKWADTVGTWSKTLEARHRGLAQAPAEGGTTVKKVMRGRRRRERSSQPGVGKTPEGREPHERNSVEYPGTVRSGVNRQGRGKRRRRNVAGQASPR